MGPPPILRAMAARVALLDLYDTLVWSDWFAWQGRLADRLGITHEVLGHAFSRTRPARSLGTHPDVEGDLTAVLEAASRPADGASDSDA